MNEEQLKLIEENIAEVISGNILLASDGPRIAAMVMERLEVEGLIGEQSSTLYRPDSFKNEFERWTFEELNECTICRDNGKFTFVDNVTGRTISVTDSWLNSDLGYGLVEMDILIRKAGLRA